MRFYGNTDQFKNQKKTARMKGRPDSRAQLLQIQRPMRRHPLMRVELSTCRGRLMTHRCRLIQLKACRSRLMTHRCRLIQLKARKSRLMTESRLIQLKTGLVCGAAPTLQPNMTSAGGTMRGRTPLQKAGKDGPARTRTCKQKPNPKRKGGEQTVMYASRNHVDKKWHRKLLELEK